MAKQNQAALDAHVANIIKVGKPRTSKVFKKKGNAAARTSKRGNGKRIR